MPIISGKMKKEQQKAEEAENKRKEEERAEAEKKELEENEKKEKDEEEKKMRHIIKKAKKKAKRKEEKANQAKLSRLSKMRKELALIKKGLGAKEVGDESGMERAGFSVVRTEELGDGQFSKVYKAKLNIDIELAVKIVTIDSKLPTNYQANLKAQSCEIMRYLGSDGEVGQAKIPQLAKVYEIFMTPKKFYIFMEEYMPATIEKRLNSGEAIDEGLAKKWCKEVAKALDYLHSIGVAHRGVRADNVIFDKENNVKLIGLGYACIFWDSDMEQVITQKKESGKEKERTRGSHFPPEAFQGDYDPSAADVFSWGCLVCQILTKKLPFDPKNDKIEEQWSSFSESHTMEEGVKTLLACVFQSDASKRIKMQEIVLDAWIKE